MLQIYHEVEVEGRVARGMNVSGVAFIIEVHHGKPVLVRVIARIMAHVGSLLWCGWVYCEQGLAVAEVMRVHGSGPSKDWPGVSRWLACRVVEYTR